MRLIAGIILWLVMGLSALAHEVRPAYLNIVPKSDSEFAVTWKQPVVDGSRLKITPTFPEDCTETSSHELSMTGATVIEQWSIQCGLKSGIISLEGLDRTLTDAFLQIEYLDGETVSTVLKPYNLSLDLSAKTPSAAQAYVVIGIEHVIFGWDHLLFITGLVLLVSARQIIGVATAFTVAHSITLAVTALGFVSVPSRPVEILIAASIVLLAIEVIRKHQGQVSLAVKRPWMIAFFIGLIHGFGFAGALADIGLPRGQELLSLFLFNIGVEIGQIAIILVLLAVLFVVTKLSKPARKPTEILVTYGIATIGMFWVIERMSAYLA